MSDNWVVQNLENALEVWNGKLSEIWQLITQSPQDFKGGAIWNVVADIHGALQAIGYALLVLFFVVGVVKTCGSFVEVKKPEHALKLFVRFALAKALITYGMELMLALLSIIQGVVSSIMNAAGFGAPNSTVLPAEIVTAIEDCGFFESIPLWAVTLIGGLVIWVLSFVMILSVFGSCFGIFFSGEDSGTGQTMPAVVREINQEYESRLDEIKNGTAHDVLEMSGSRAVWPEVLAIYAVKTTTDPDNPQEVATMDDSKKELLKEMFWAMNEINSRTETAAATQIVETDDGEGNIIEEEVEVTTTTLYITVTHNTADEMADAYSFNADQRAQLAELLAEENRSMWSSVLYGIGVGDGEIVVVALSQLGNVGGQPYWSWYGFNSRVEWCACFVSWCANECGYLDAGVIPKTAGCISGSNWFKDRGLWQDNSYEPRPGDIVYFDWDEKGSSGPQDGLADHVGIVEKVENGMVYTVEGNSGDSCRENHYAIGHYEIYGYGTLCP